MPERKKLTEWNVLEIAEREAQYLAENGTFPDLSEDELLNSVLEDTDLFMREWDYLCDYLTELMETRNPDGYWYIEAVNFGWRKLNGHQRCQALTGKELLRKILPRAECTFTIYDDTSGGFAIQNFHHDSPMGKEWYYAYPDSEYYCESCGHRSHTVLPCPGCGEHLCQDCSSAMGIHVCESG